MENDEKTGAAGQNETAETAETDYETAFTGGYQHSMDAKGRLIIPLPFRESLGSVFCIGPSFNFKAIAIYPDTVWKKTREEYKKLAKFNSKLKLYLENFDAMSYRDQQVDAQGRVLLPARLRAKILGEERDVDVLGSGDHVRIVGRAATEEQFTAFMDSLPDILDEMDRLGAGAANEQDS